MKFKITIILLSLLFSFEMEAQTIKNQGNNFNLGVTYPEQSNKKIYLGQYWRQNSYARDSAMLSTQGKAVFTSKEKYPEGQYFLYMEPDLRIDLLIGSEQNKIQIDINKNDFLKSNVTGSSDTKLLWSYLAKVNSSNNLRETLDGQLSDPKLSSQKKVSIEKEIAKEEEAMQTYAANLIQANKDTWFGHFLRGMTPVKQPYSDPKNDKEFAENNNYGRVHYFDNMNLTDPRMWRTNYMTSNIDFYLQQWVDPTPDSLAIAAYKLVEKTKGNEACFREMLSYLINSTMNSDRMGDENIWTKLYEDYIFNKKTPWIDSSQLLNIQNTYEHIKNNRIGMNAHNLTLATIDDKTFETNSIKAEYIMLYFYGHDCHFCKEETPRIYNEIYAKYKDKGLQVIAINIVGNNKKEWEKFIKDNKMTDWINAYDPKNKSEYWMYFDTSYIPAVFVLDKNKKIVAKKVGSDGLKQFFEFYIK